MSALDLDFLPGLPMELRVDLTEAARRAGMPLWQLELLGQDEGTATGFVEAARRGEAREFVGEVHWDILEGRYQARLHGERGPVWRRSSMTSSFPEVLPVSLVLGALARAGRRGLN